MFFVAKYDLEIAKPLIQLKKELKNNRVEKHYLSKEYGFGKQEIDFSQHDTYEFVMITKSRIGLISPEAHLKLREVSPNKTAIDVEIRLSAILKLGLIFFYLANLAIFIWSSRIKMFGYYHDLNWFTRILFSLSVIGFTSFIVWIIFKLQTNNFKRGINEFVEKY